MSKLKWTQISPTLSDETVTFRVDGCEGMTAKEFIVAVINQSPSRFFSFRINGEGLGGSKIELGATKKLTPEQDADAQKALAAIVESATCNGGWGQMNYTIKTKSV